MEKMKEAKKEKVRKEGRWKGGKERKRKGRGWMRERDVLVYHLKKCHMSVWPVVKYSCVINILPLWLSVLYIFLGQIHTQPLPWLIALIIFLPRRQCYGRVCDFLKAKPTEVASWERYIPHVKLYRTAGEQHTSTVWGKGTGSRECALNDRRCTQSVSDRGKKTYLFLLEKNSWGLCFWEGKGEWGFMVTASGRERTAINNLSWQV